MLLVHVLKFQFPKPQCWKLLVIVESSVDMRYIIPRNQNLPKLQAPGGDVISAKRSFATKMSRCVSFALFVESLSRVWLFVTPWTAARQAALSFTISPSFCRLMFIELVMPSNHLILCYPLLLLPSIFPSIRVFFSESALRIRWPKYWNFSFSISPSNEYSGFISFWINWLDLLAVQGTLKSLLQHHSSKASILRHSAFFMVKLSHPYMTTGKTIGLTIWTFVSKVMSWIIPSLYNQSVCCLQDSLNCPNSRNPSYF